MWTALPTEIQQWLRLKSINELSDLDTVKPIMLSHMQHTEMQRHPVDFFQRPQRPGESYAQFALALQSIFGTCFRNRAQPDLQEELICANFIAGVYPPTLQGKLKSLDRCSIAELIKSATENGQTTHMHDQPYPTRRREKPRYATNPLPRNPRPKHAGQGKSRNNPVYTLRSGTCPVIRATIRSRRCRFLVDTSAAISIIKPTTVLDNLIGRVDRNHTIGMEAVNETTFKSEGSIILKFKLGNRHFKHKMHLSSMVNGDDLLGIDFLEKHRSQILLDEGKLIMDNKIQLELGRERPLLIQHLTTTKSSQKDRLGKLLKALNGAAEEIRPLLMENADIFALEDEPTGRTNVITHSIDTWDAKPVALRPRRIPIQY